MWALIAGVCDQVDPDQAHHAAARPPFITSTLQQAAANRLGFRLQRTMRIAQQLYEGVDIGRRGQTALITYMRTDSTHLSGEALIDGARLHRTAFGEDYLPDKPNFYRRQQSRPGSPRGDPPHRRERHAADRSAAQLTDEQFKLYDLIWRRFVACQMTPAEWDSTTVLIATHARHDADVQGHRPAAGVRRLLQGHRRAQRRRTDPARSWKKTSRWRRCSSTRRSTSPARRRGTPRRRCRRSWRKKASAGRAPTRRSSRRSRTANTSRRVSRAIALTATDLGHGRHRHARRSVPQDHGRAPTRGRWKRNWTRSRTRHHDWVKMLEEFYGPFAENLERPTRTSSTPRPSPSRPRTNVPSAVRGRCIASARTGGFSPARRYPDCDYAAPIDREGKPQEPEMSNIACPECGGA